MATNTGEEEDVIVGVTQEKTEDVVGAHGATLGVVPENKLLEHCIH